MPHIIIEHSSNISKSSVQSLQKDIQNIMQEIAQGNFEVNQCKCRSFSFDEYLVGELDQENSSFMHITIKILTGRNLEVRKELGQKVMNFSKSFFETLSFSPTGKDEIIEAAQQIIDAVTGIPHPQLPLQNKDLAGRRCDISVDVVEMDRETYQKVRIKN